MAEEAITVAECQEKVSEAYYRGFGDSKESAVWERKISSVKKTYAGFGFVAGMIIASGIAHAFFL